MQLTLQVLAIVVPSAIFVFIGHLLNTRITDVKNDVKELRDEIKATNQHFFRHLTDLHGSDLKERNGWQAYFT